MVRIPALAESELAVSVIAVEKSCQKTTPAETKRKRSLKFWVLSISHERVPKIRIFSVALTTDQAKPSAVCLYRAYTSRRDKYRSKPVHSLRPDKP